MQKGQVLSTDLVVSLMLVAVCMGLVAQSLEAHYQQAASAFENAKMHQMALDAAAIKYYNDVDGVSPVPNEFEGLDGSVVALGYSMGNAPALPLDACACMISTRGTEASPINVYVCRGSCD